MSLSPTMRMFGTAINYGFGDVEETGILIAVDEILEEKRMRHIESFVKNDPEDCQITSGVNKVFTPKVVTPQEDCSRWFCDKDPGQRHRSCPKYNRAPPVLSRRVQALLYYIVPIRG